MVHERKLKRKGMFSLLCGLMAILATSSFAEPLKLAVYPSNDPDKLIVPMRLMAEYLSEKSGVAIVPVVTRDYDELLERLTDKTVDIGWINPVNYIRLKASTPSLKYIATYMEMNPRTNEVTPYYQSYIISRKDRGPGSLREAVNLRFAFTDPGSTSGYAFPNMMLRRQNIVATTYFSKVFFLKKHDRVIEALVSGAIDVGAVSDGTYFSAVQRYGDIFTILEQSPPIPLDAIVAQESVSDALILQFRKILTEMGRDHPFNRSMLDNLGWYAAGFAVKDDSFYDPMREALRESK